MKIEDIIMYSLKPELYQKGTSFMWSDEHISKQLLEIHTNPDINLASRKLTTIKETVKWIMENSFYNREMKILDLGCGPGLYAELFAEAGHQVTGVDISNNSIEYAQKESVKKHLRIDYINGDYLDLNLQSNNFDLVIMIYTDFGVLLPYEREKLLKLIHGVLKKGGVFIFDIMKDNNIENKTTDRTWEIVEYGFWKPEPYLSLSDSFFYEKEKVILNQNIIIDKNNNLALYRFWIHFFSQKDIEIILNKFGFGNTYITDSVLPDDDIWSGNNVMFCKAVKE